MFEQKIAWATDIHLDYASPEMVSHFFDRVNRSGAKKLLITGDITEGYRIEKDILSLSDNIDMPIYFILGNHEYYYSSFKQINEIVTELSKKLPNLTWMDQAGIVELSSRCGMVGFGSWGDGKAGNYQNSHLSLNDQIKISDFQGLNKAEIGRKLNSLGKEAADYFERVIPEALDRYPNVLALMHCPPFDEACLMSGWKPDDYRPYFMCQQVGEVMRRIMLENSDKKLQVLAGHTHEPASVQILPNIWVNVSAASYGHPDFTTFKLN